MIESRSTLGGEVSGFPDAAIIASYEKLEPGASKRLLHLFESEVKHRREIEHLTVVAEIEDLKAARLEARLGQIFAFSIGTIAIIGGCYSAVHGSQIAGAFIGGGGVVGLVTVFILGRRVQQETPLL